MLFSLGHGQHVAVTSEANAPATRARAAGGDVSPPTEPIAAVAPGVAQMAAQSARELVGAGQADLPERALAPTEPDGTFCYYFESAPSQPKRPDMPDLLDQLAETMMTDAGDNNSSIPAIFTYIGQFIDHDITANTDRDTDISDIGGTTFDPTPRPKVRKKLGNLRDGSLALDSLYGDDTPTTPFVEKLTGLMRFPGDKAKMRLGIPDDLGGTSGRPPIPALPDNATDLPRLGFLMRRGDITQAELDALPQPLKGVFVDSNGNAIRERAIIGDGRNDENLLVAQFHVAFLRFHNKIVDAIGNVGTANKRFLRARRLTRWHYQWLIVHDYLEKLCDPAILAEVIDQEAPLYRDFFEHHPAKSPKLPMPIEFSVAAYRFGHTMIRGAYDHNRFFGNAVPPDTPIIPARPLRPAVRLHRQRPDEQRGGQQHRPAAAALGHRVEPVHRGRHAVPLGAAHRHPPGAAAPGHGERGRPEPGRPRAAPRPPQPAARLQAERADRPGLPRRRRAVPRRPAAGRRPRARRDRGADPRRRLRRAHPALVLHPPRGREVVGRSPRAARQLPRREHADRPAGGRPALLLAERRGRGPVGAGRVPRRPIRSTASRRC